MKGKWWLLKISAVSVDVPLILIGRTALASLGMNYDIRENKADFLALDLRHVMLGFTSTGHPSLDVMAPAFPKKVDWSLTEVFVPPIKKIGEIKSDVCGEAYMASSLNPGWYRLFFTKIEAHLKE